MNESHPPLAVVPTERRSRRPLSIATAGLVAAATLTAAAIAISGAGAAAADPAKPASSAAETTLAAAPSSAPSSASDPLSSQLAELLHSRGQVSLHGDWLPWGEKVSPGQPTLADGTPGRGGAVMLEGSSVSVLVSPRHGPECGYRAGEDSNCHAVPGGFVQTNDLMTDGSDRHYAAYYTGDVAIMVETAKGVLDVATLTQLAQDAAFRS